MASLNSLGCLAAKKLTPILMKHSSCAVVAVRKASYWNRDWMPGPYPKTPEERAAAAKKYNLRVEDYEPYPDDGMGYGDYPKLPLISAESRGPYEDYDIPTMRRNFNEPIHVDYDMVMESRVSPDIKPPLPHWQMLTIFIGITGGFTCFVLYTNKYPIIHPVKPKQYPHTGKVHYTFELEDGSISD